MAKNNTHEQPSSFWFGLMTGGVVGTSLLYFFGTKHGRKQLKNIVDAIEDLDDKVLEELSIFDERTEDGDRSLSKVATNIHTLLDKIQDSIPAKEVRKYFVKDGKLMK